jgi:hypothetical protein
MSAPETGPEAPDSQEASGTVVPPNLLTFDRSSLPALFVVLERLERGIGLPQGFYEQLADTGDDWSFVVKVHALMESSLTSLLTERIADKRVPDVSKLRGALARLEMSRSQIGKVDLAFTLGDLTERDRLFLRMLSTLRNTFVHRVQNVTLTLKDYVAGLDTNQRRNFANALIVQPTEHATKVVLSYPRRAIWFIGLLKLTMVRLASERNQLARGAPGINAPALLTEMEALSADMARVTEWIQERLNGAQSGAPQ